MEQVRSRVALEPQVSVGLSIALGCARLRRAVLGSVFGGALLAPLMLFAHTNDVVLMRIVPQGRGEAGKVWMEVTIDASAHPVLRHVENPVRMVAESVFVVDGRGRTAPLSASTLQQSTLEVRTGSDVPSSCPVPMIPEPGEPPSEWMTARWRLSEVELPARLTVSKESKLNVLLWVAGEGDMEAAPGWGWISGDVSSGALPFPESRFRMTPAIGISVAIALMGLGLNGFVLVRRKSLFGRVPTQE